MGRDYLQTLRDLQQERTEAEHQLAALQRRVDALRKASEGIEELLRSEQDIPSQAPSEVPAALRASTPTLAMGAQTIIQSDPARSWMPRQVWEVMVERGWAKETRNARAAIRVALMRLTERGLAERVDAPPTHAYRWTGGVRGDFTTSQLPLSSNGLAPVPTRED